MIYWVVENKIEQLNVNQWTLETISEAFWNYFLAGIIRLNCVFSLFPTQNLALQISHVILCIVTKVHLLPYESSYSSKIENKTVIKRTLSIKTVIKIVHKCILNYSCCSCCCFCFCCYFHYTTLCHLTYDISNEFKINL